MRIFMESNLSSVNSIGELIDKLDVGDSKVYTDSINKYNRMVKQNSYRLLRLVNNFIDINRIDTNGLEANLVRGNIVEVVENITLSIIEYTKMKGIHLVFDTETEDKIMSFDPDMIERIILNLLSNAVKFTDPGGMIQVNLYDMGEKVRISIKDNGAGIPNDKTDHIFERFTQLDNTFRRKVEGSGIGLSLVKSLVEMLGGTISVNSEVGKGSEFIIELPVRNTAENYTREHKAGRSNVESLHIEFADIYF